MQEVKATVNQIQPDKTAFSKQVTIEYDFGKNLEELAELIGEEVTYNYAVSALKVALQGVIRRVSITKDEKGFVSLLSPDEIDKAVEAWKPGEVTRSSSSKMEKMQADFAKLSEDKQAEFLAFLKGGGVPGEDE